MAVFRLGIVAYCSIEGSLPQWPRRSTHGVQLASCHAPRSLTLAASAATLGEAAPFPMATIDEDLGQLEKDIRQLKIEYEQYFAGGRKRPPTEIEWRVELLVKRYGERNSQMNYGQRFRFNGLTQTYAKYREMFRKRLKQKEEATVIRHFGAAAKEIEALRAGRAEQPVSTVATASVLVQKGESWAPTEDSEVPSSTRASGTQKNESVKILRNLRLTTSRTFLPARKSNSAKRMMTPWNL